MKDNLGTDGILFLQETQWTNNNKALWKTNFQGQHFFYGPSDCCCACALTGYLGFKSFIVKKSIKQSHWLNPYA